MNVDVPTAYPDLNGVLDELVRSVRKIVGDDFVGAYLQGSFATGGFDQHSDADTRQPSPARSRSPPAGNCGSTSNVPAVKALGSTSAGSGSRCGVAAARMRPSHRSKSLAPSLVKIGLHHL